MSTSDSQSSPAQAGVEKLSVIPVFTVAKSPTELCTSEQNGVTVVPLYLSKKAADEALSAYTNAIPGFSASVVYFMLDNMYKIIEAYQAEYEKQSKTIVFPIVVRQENTEKALEILKSEGYGDDQIQANLSVPVFYSEPIITIESSDGTGSKQVFFIDYSDLQSAIDKLPDTTDTPKVKVANLSEVVDQISASSDPSQFEFYPTPEFLTLKKIYEAQLELDGVAA